MGMFRFRALSSSTQGDGGSQPLRRQRLTFPRNLKQAADELIDLVRHDWNERRLRTREVRQLEPNECGAVCLAIVLEHHGLHQPMSALHHACGVSRDGSSAAQLAKAAERYGLKAKGFKAGIEALRSIPVPAVLFWEFNHFVVLESVQDDIIWINDPASGRLGLDHDSFDRSYTGVVLTLQPGETFQPSGQPPSRSGELIRLLRHISIKQRAALAVTVCASSGLIMALCQASATAWMLALILLSALMAPLLNRIQSTLLLQQGRRLQQRLLTIPNAELHQHVLSELASRHLRLSDVVDVLLQDVLANLPLLLALLIGSAALLWQSPISAALLLVGTLAVGMLLQRVERLQHPVDNRSRRMTLRSQIRLQQALQDPATVKSLSMEQQVFQRWSGLQVVASEHMLQMERQHRLLSWIPQLLGWSLPLLLVMVNGPDISTVATALVWIWGLDRFQRLQQNWIGIGHSIDRIQAVWGESQDPMLLHSPEHVSQHQHQASDAHAIKLNNIQFSYIPNHQPLLSGLNIDIRAGEFVAIQGSGSCGKSTLLRLMAGLLQPDQGEVVLDGDELQNWPRDQRIKAIAMVEQEDTLLDISLRDNLTLWNSDINDEHIDEVCAAIGLQEVIRTLPNGINSPLGRQGINLSGGQRQLLAIARALLQKPGLLLLDEATSALDALSESRVIEYLRSLNCTVVMVAHRIGSIKQADRVFSL